MVSVTIAGLALMIAGLALLLSGDKSAFHEIKETRTGKMMDPFLGVYLLTVLVTIVSNLASVIFTGHSMRDGAPAPIGEGPHLIVFIAHLSFSFTLFLLFIAVALFVKLSSKRVLAEKADAIGPLF